MNRYYLIVLISLLASNLFSQEKYQYVGSKKCAECHFENESPQYFQWLKGRHSHAYWRLGSDWSKYLAKINPKYPDVTEPITNEKCLKCHVTGRQDSLNTYAASFYKEEGVGCEACHGPASGYLDSHMDGNRESFLANGGIIPGETVCVNCHRRDFIFEEKIKKISHPFPGKNVD